MKGVSAMQFSAGPPPGKLAPISSERGSAPPKAHAATSVGAAERSDGPPKPSSAPLGGSAVREATSVGAIP